MAKQTVRAPLDVKLNSIKWTDNDGDHEHETKFCLNESRRDEISDEMWRVGILLLSRWSSRLDQVKT